MTARNNSLMLPLASLLLVASIVFGGGTRPGFLSDVILQLATLPVLVAVAWAWKRRLLGRDAYLAIGFCAVLVIVPVLQLLPLPPSVWTALPGRAEISAVHQLLENRIPWASWSVAPHFTAQAALSLLPPITLFLAVLQLDNRERRVLSLVLLAVGLLSVLLGLVQLAQGELSPLRFYATTNHHDAVGFFANRNHFAALIYCLMLMAAAWLPHTGEDRTPRRENGAPLMNGIPHMVQVTAVAATLAVLIAGEAMARSRGGLLISLAALAGCGLIASPVFLVKTTDKTPKRLLFSTLALAILLSAQFASLKIIDRFAGDASADGRIAYGRNTIAAARNYGPAGTGVGTFTVVYQQFQRVEDEVLDAFANRAHNDVLEAILESGIVGVIVMMAFVVWYGRQVRQVWRRSKNPGDPDLMLQRAASLIVALLAVHSLVDYPLRTGAVMAVAAMACALLLPASANDRRTSRQHLAKRSYAPDARLPT